MNEVGTFWRSVFPPVENPTLRILSHGGGVQTWTIAFMSARGDIDPIDAAIMGDPGAERKVTWDYHEYAAPKMPFPVIIEKLGDIYEHAKRSKLPHDGKQIVTLPYYLEAGGRMMRTCTSSLKIDAVTKATRRLLGVERGHRVPKGTNCEILVGISTDEKQRAGGFPAEKWQTVRYPLLEAGMSYADCVKYLSDRQIMVPPRSRCVICPFRSNESWRALDPDEFELACQFDEALREGGNPRGYQSAPYLHNERRPLREVDLTRSQDLFPEDDCMGACGV